MVRGSLSLVLVVVFLTSFWSQDLLKGQAEAVTQIDEAALSQLGDEETADKVTGQVWSELKVNLPADELWAVYSSPGFPQLVPKILPDSCKNIDTISGGGLQGSILNVTLQPREPGGPVHWIERVMKLDNKTRTRISRQISGGYLDLGFLKYQDQITITKKGDSSMVKQSMTFVIKKGFESNAKHVTVTWDLSYAIAKYIVDNKGSNAVFTGEPRIQNVVE